ncbi:hypothetical protein TL16_g12978 [Triparma laevis f. inornata]|uniref:BolA-like protein n=2 Tax=Triparma laevis TaxID=1534972 RepID=A0A9W7DTY4_9STRA|nr:hypothetical protein TrLO_g160 [Triparma laevis f. longispina]GMH94694.1 hypothetical protein TL16_g12978 [Triparma laevis f. inornata]
MLHLLLLLLLTTISTSFYLPSPSFLPSTSLFSSSPDLSTTVSKCESKITSLLSPTSLKVTGADDDPNGSHIFIECVSEKFEGLNSLKRQQLVYKAIWEEMGGDGGEGIVHAVDGMKLSSPSE